MANGNWEPTAYVRNIAFIVREIGLSTVVVLFLLGQQAGWIPNYNEWSKHNNRVLLQNRDSLVSLTQNSNDTVDAIKAACYNAANNKQEQLICRYGLSVAGRESEQ